MRNYDNVYINLKTVVSYNKQAELIQSYLDGLHYVPFIANNSILINGGLYVNIRCLLYGCTIRGCDGLFRYMINNIDSSSKIIQKLTDVNITDYYKSYYTDKILISYSGCSTGYVYFIQFENSMKIGTSIDPVHRCRQHTVDYNRKGLNCKPVIHTLFVYKNAETAKRAEKAFHIQFKHLLFRGFEWFSNVNEILKELNKLQNKQYECIRD